MMLYVMLNSSCVALDSTIEFLLIDFQAYETKIILRGSSDSIEAARNMIMEKVNNSA